MIIWQREHLGERVLCFSQTRWPCYSCFFFKIWTRVCHSCFSQLGRCSCSFAWHSLTCGTAARLAVASIVSWRSSPTDALRTVFTLVNLPVHCVQLCILVNWQTCEQCRPSSPHSSRRTMHSNVMAMVICGAHMTEVLVNETHTEI